MSDPAQYGYRKIYTALGRCPMGTGDLAKSLAEAVPNFLPLVRNRSSHFAKKGKDGQPVKDYADLAQCHKSAAKALAEQGLVVVQTLTTNTEGEMVMCTQLLHSSGQYIESMVPIKANPASPQQMAAAITYARRTSYCAMVGLAADDDDDGATAEEAACASGLDDSARISALATQKLKDAKTPEERANLLSMAEARAKEGKLSLSALQSLKDLSAELDKPADTKTERKRAKEAVTQ